MSRIAGSSLRGARKQETASTMSATWVRKIDDWHLVVRLGTGGTMVVRSAMPLYRQSYTLRDLVVILDRMETGWVMTRIVSDSNIEP